MAELTKEEIRKWLKQHGRSRDWLAEQCGVSKPTVDNWFSNRPIPGSSLATIGMLMAKEPEQVDDTGLIQFTTAEFERIDSACRAAGYQDRPAFYRDAILQLVDEIEAEEDELARQAAGTSKPVPFPLAAEGDEDMPSGGDKLTDDPEGYGATG